MTARSRRLVFAALAAALMLALAAAPASGHAGGKVELFLKRLEFHPIDATTWQVHLGLIDSDSGNPASGFDASMTAAGPGGQSVGLVALDDHGDGEYYGTFPAGAGTWSFAVLAEERPGGEPAVTLRKSMSVTLAPGADAVAGSNPASHSVESEAQGSTGAARSSSGPPALVLVGATLAAGTAGVVTRRRRRRRHPALAPTTFPR